jgi:hypothetical protein
MLGVEDAYGIFWAVWVTVHLLLLDPEKWFYSVERVEVGETMDTKNGQ